MSTLPDIAWPEDGKGADAILTKAQELLGDHSWLVFVPNPRPFDATRDQIADRLGAQVLKVNNSAAFVVDGHHSQTALQIFFENGAPEWAVLGFADQPTSAMITDALNNADAKPAQRLLVFDSNTLMTLI